MKQYLTSILAIFLTTSFCGCADLWHELRYGQKDAPQGGVIPIQTTEKRSLSKDEKLNLLTQKLIMAISMKGMEGIRLKCADSSSDCRKIFTALYQERIVEYGEDYSLAVLMNATPEEVRISETASGKVVLRAVLPEE